MYIRKVFTVHLVNEDPAATVCRQPQDLCPSACERRWPGARRPVSQDNLLAGPKESKTSDLGDVCEYLEYWLRPVSLTGLSFTTI